MELWLMGGAGAGGQTGRRGRDLGRRRRRAAKCRRREFASGSLFSCIPALLIPLSPPSSTLQACTSRRSERPQPGSSSRGLAWRWRGYRGAAAAASA